MLRLIYTNKTCLFNRQSVRKWTTTLFLQMEIANFIPMYKTDHETDKCNYRPISLLSVSGKIMESAVASSIMSHISDNNL